MKLVYIVLLNWNGWADTLNCIDSIMKSDYSNFKIEIVDNGSTDNSIERFQEVHPEILLTINEKNLGFGGGCNIGIQHGLNQNAEYIWLLNNDTLIDKKALSALVELADSDSKIGATGSVLYHMGIEPPRIQAWGGGHVNLWTGKVKHFTGYESYGNSDYLTGASMLLKAEAIKEIEGFDESFFMYWEDVDLCFRLRKKGWKLKVAENSRIWHKESASLGKGNPLLARYFAASAVHFFLKHAPLPWLPSLLGVGNRLFKYALRGRLEMVRYGLIGARERWINPD